MQTTDTFETATLCKKRNKGGVMFLSTGENYTPGYSMSKGVAVYRQRFAFPLLSREEQGIITYRVCEDDLYLIHCKRF